MLDANQTRAPIPTGRSTRCARIAASAARSPIRSRTTRCIYAEGRDGPANHNRLCVKGRFGFDYIHHPHRLTEAAGAAAERAEGRQRPGRSGQSVDAFPRSELGRGARPRGRRPRAHPRRQGRQGAGRFRLRQGLERGSLSVPEAGTHRLRLQQCRPLHAAVPRLLGRGADGRSQFRRRVGAVRSGAGCRGDHRHRRQSDGQSPGRGDLHQERGQEGRQADRDRIRAARRCRATPPSTWRSSPAPTSRC